MGDVQDALPEGRGSLLDGKAAHIGLAGGVSAGAKGGHVGILAGDHMNILHGDAHRVRHHLGIGGVAALADLRLAGLELERAVLVQHHAAGGGFQ